MPGWRDRTFHMGLLAIATGALLLRIVVLLLHLGSPVPVDHEVVAHAGAIAGPEAGPLQDNVELVAEVDDRGNDASPPLWPAVRSIATLGIGDTTGHQLVAAGLGTATVVLVGFAGYRLGGRRTGLVAAVVAGAYPGLWIYESATMAESLLVLVVAGTILVAFAYFDRPRWPLAAGLGAAAGLLTLVRTEQALVLVLIVVPLVAVRARGDRRRLALQVGVAVGAMALVVLPWWVATTATHDGPVPVSVGMGADLVAASCRPTLGGPVNGLSDARCAFAAGTRLDGPAAADAAQRDAALRHRALEVLGEHGQRTPLTVGVRIARATGILGASQIVDQWSAWSHQPAPVVWLWLTSGLVLAVLAVRGTSALRDQRIPVLPLLGFVGVAVAGAAVFGGDLRYRAAAAVPLVLLGAVGLTWQDLAPPLQRRRGKLRPPAVAWRSTLPDDFWDDLVERLARMDDDEPLHPSAAPASSPPDLVDATGRPPQEPGGPGAGTSPVIDLRDLPPPPDGPGAPGRRGTDGLAPPRPRTGDGAVIDLRDLPPPPADVAPWPVPVTTSAGPTPSTATAGASNLGIALRDLLRPGRTGGDGGQRAAPDHPDGTGPGVGHAGGSRTDATPETRTTAETFGLPLPPPPRRSTAPPADPGPVAARPRADGASMRTAARRTGAPAPSWRDGPASRRRGAPTTSASDTPVPPPPGPPAPAEAEPAPGRPTTSAPRAQRVATRFHGSVR